MRSIKAVLGLLLLLLPAAVMGQSGPFLDLTAIPVGTGPSGVAIGDLNGDGIPDMAVANTADSTVSIALGNGDGSFKPPTTIAVGTNPGSVAIADLNHDGKADLVVGTTTGILQVLLGNGDGTFGSPSTVLPAQSPAISFPALQVADFNGDGKLDIALVIEYSNATTGVSILLGAGDGTFTIPPGLRVPGLSGLQSLAVGDFDGNGTIDMAFTVATNAGSNGLVYILLNDGTGKFTVGTPISLEGQPLGVTVGKFTGSGHLDLAVGVTSSSVAVLAGNGDGTFQAATYSTVGQFPSTVAAADLNGDGNEDIVAANSGSNTLSVLMGKGNGTFQTAVSYATLSYPAQVATADMNRDGRPDVVVTDSGQNRAQVFLGTKAGTLVTGSYPTGEGPFLIASGDLNGDGISDIAVYNSDNSISLYLADGHGGFALSSIANTCPSVDYFADGMVIGDFQGANIPSLVLACSPNAQNSTYLVQYSVGAAGNATVLQTFSISGEATLNVTDFNGDGISDLVLTTPTPSQITVKFGGPTPFASQMVFTASNPNYQSVVGDFNGDGRPDVLSSTSGCFVLLSGPANSYTTVNGTLCGGAASGDFNGDGLDDFLANDAVNPVSVNISKGDGTFLTGVPLDGRNAALVADVADFNGDGILDAVIGVNNGGLTLSLGAIDGSFGSAGTRFAPNAEQAFYFASTVGDFDNNGSPDLAVVENPAGAASAIGVVDVFLNKNHFFPTATLLSQSAGSTITFGQPIELTATVSSKSGTPTGQIVFKQAGVPAETVALVSGVATGSVAGASAAGQYGFTALYSGDGTFNGSLSKRFLVTVNQAHSTTTLTGTAAPKLGVSMVYTATVTPQISGTPTGTIQFFADGEPIGTGTLAGGQATVSYVAMTMGTHKIEANYSGDTNFVTSLGVLSVKVGKAVATVSVAASANPAVYGTPNTLTATVTDSDGAVATGPVVFKEGTTIYGTVSLTAGAAQLVLPSLPIGTHKITAQYGGDTEDGTANGTISLVVQGEPTTTTVATSVPATNFGQSVTFTATIAAATGSPDGTLTFKNGSAVLGTVTVTSGQAQFSVSTLAAGTHTITALYNGGSAYASSSGTLQQIVEKSATTTALTSSANPATTGTSVTFTATVTSAEPEQVTGNVTFKDGKTSLGTVALVNGQAQLSTALLTKGAHTITASYAASTDFAASSTTLAQTMQ